MTEDCPVLWCCQAMIRGALSPRDILDRAALTLKSLGGAENSDQPVVRQHIDDAFRYFANRGIA